MSLINEDSVTNRYYSPDLLDYNSIAKGEKVLLINSIPPIMSVPSFSSNNNNACLNIFITAVNINGNYDRHQFSTENIHIYENTDKEIMPPLLRFQSDENERISAIIYIQPHISSASKSIMDSDVSDMQSWVFRHAQRKWGKTAAECAEIFQKYGIFDFIAECYDLLHVSSYESTLKDVETILRNKGVVV